MIDGYASCGFYHVLTEQNVTGEAFGKLYAMGTQVSAVSDSDSVYVISATDGERMGVLVANVGEDTEISTNLDGRAYLIDEEHPFTDVGIDTSAFKLPKDSVIYIER